MDLTAPFANPRPIDPIIQTVEGFTHAPDGDDYDTGFFEPQPISFTLALEDVNRTKLRNALSNPDLGTPWLVGSDQWVSTKGRGSVEVIDGNFVGSQPFYDPRKVAISVETLWEESRATGNVGYRWDEVYFPPQNISIHESSDLITLSIEGLVYGKTEQITAFSDGNES